MFADIVLLIILVPVCIVLAILAVRWLRQKAGQLDKPWLVLLITEADRQEQLRRLRAAGFESLTEFIDICERLVNLRQKYERHWLEEDEVFPAPPDNGVLVRILEEFNPLEDQHLFKGVLKGVLIEWKRSRISRLYLAVRREDAAVYDKLQQISFPRMLEADKLSLVKAMFGVAKEPLKNLKIYVSDSAVR